jgi:hypothetical protein
MAIQYSDDVRKAMDEAVERVTHFLAEVGLVALNWNDVEEILERLIWYYLGSDEVGHIITSKMHNQSRCNVLTNLADARESLPQIKVRIDHFAAVFDILRLNRNAIIHSVNFNLHHASETVSLERLTKTIRTREYDTYSMPIDALTKLNEQMVQLESFGKNLIAVMRKRSGLIDQPFFDWEKPPPLLEIFPLPEKLNSLRPQAPK